MVQIKYSNLIQEFKGKIGGLTFKANYTAPSSQIKSSPRKQVSNFNQSPKLNLSSVAQSWRNLSQANRDTWIAAAPFNQFYNCFGELYTPSGFQLYMSVNSKLLYIGVDPLLEYVAPNPTFVFSNVVATWDSDPHECHLSFDNIDMLERWCIGLKMGMPVSAGQSFHDYRICTIIILDSSNVDNPFHFAPPYNSHYPLIFEHQIKKKCSMSLNAIDSLTGHSVSYPQFYIYSPL